VAAPSKRALSPLPVREAVERLHDAATLEEFSPLAGTGVLVIDLDDVSGLEKIAPSALTSATARLAELPCPCVGVRANRAGSSVSRLDARVDVVAGSQVELERVLDAVSAHPIAATALVQLLRHSERLDIHEALIAESLVYSTLQSGPEFAAWLSGRKSPSASGEGAAQPPVSVSRNGPRLDLVLNRPQRHNAYSAAMRDALVAGLEIAAADASIAEIVLGAKGASFSAGGDLAEFGTLPDPATAHVIRSTRNAARLLARLSDRVRAEVHGACIGAGIELAAFAKRVVAKGDAFFELPEVAMGLVPGAGGTASIPRRIGRQRTAYLALTGERIDARIAHEWGLVDEIVA
jgi:hypothetical protein